VILSTGPLTGDALARRLRRDLGDALYFYDAIAPIVDADTVDRAHVFEGARRGKGDGYLNCALTREEYEAFVAEVRSGKQVVPHSFEEERYFEGCLPIEVMAIRGTDTLRFGPLKPVGFRDAAGGRPWAVVQLRAENRERTAYNLVGFQTRLLYPEQRRIFRMIPALRTAEFLRFGSIHRNTYVDAPRRLGPELELRGRPVVRLAGLLVGVEGYVECAATGFLTALFLARRLRGRTLDPPPATTALGALYGHATRVRAKDEFFRPANIHFGLLPPVAGRGGREARRHRQIERAQHDIGPWLEKVAA
jgi:methylenetetrahydrofolate--tRNA-(uracil-5-)-methyltransferase